MKTFSEKYRKAREAWTGRVEVEKGTWNKMLTENDNLREESLYKDQRIEALIEMLRKAEDKLKTVREETYGNVAAGIKNLEWDKLVIQSKLKNLEKENEKLQERVHEAEYFNVSAPGTLLSIRGKIKQKLALLDEFDEGDSSMLREILEEIEQWMQKNGMPLEPMEIGEAASSEG